MVESIPAYAGNTDIDVVRPGRESKHPRVCGEHGVKSSMIPGLFETSPRMRGTRGKMNDYRNPIRNIPAYAGNTLM